MKAETMEKLEEYIEEARLGALYDDGANSTSVKHARYMEALSALREIEKDQNDFYDKQERRDLEEKKNRETVELEREKSKIGWKRMTIEMLKIFVPSLFAAGTAIWMQNRAGKLEETGRWTTEVGRQAHRQMPNVWK